MKKQTFIAIIRDGSGNAITFERFTCKKADTVKRQMLQLLQNDLYRACNKNVAKVDVYATPDGYNRAATPATSFSI